MQRFLDTTVVVNCGAGGTGCGTCRRFAAGASRVAVFVLQFNAPGKLVPVSAPTPAKCRASPTA